MGKHRTAYPAEFRAHMVKLVRAGHMPEELSREFEPTAQTIINWVARADRDAGVRHDGASSARSRGCSGSNAGYHQDMQTLNSKFR
jgi:transposase-like protein